MAALLLLQCFMPLANAQQRVKRAFIIALDQYAPGTGWGKIHSSNDTLLLKPALVRQNFLPGNIVIVSGKDLTKKKLVQAIREFTKNCGPKDIVLFHYSGHGQQVADSSGDEADYYDESIVPADASAVYAPGKYTGQNHLLDDELNVLLRALALKVHDGDLLVTMDACYSATGTRLAAFTRGTSELMASPAYEEAHRNETHKNPLPLSEPKEARLPYTVISATNAYEVNQETIHSDGRVYGPLSLCLSEALGEMQTGETYASLYQRIVKNMALLELSQTPCIEGHPEKWVFDRNINPEVNYFIPADFRRDLETFYMEAGELQGLFNGTETGIYDINATAFDKPNMIATGVVQDAGPSTCSIVVKELLHGSLDGAKKIVVTKPGYGNLFITVQLNIKDPAIEQAIRQAAANTPYIRFTGDPYARLKLESGTDGLLAAGKPAGYLQLSTPEGIALDSFTVNEEGWQQFILEQIASQMYGIYLRGISVNTPAFNVTMELQTGNCKNEPDGSVSLLPFAPGPPAAPGFVEAKSGNCFRITVINNDPQPVFFNVLAIDPLNRIMQLLPLPGADYNDYGIPGATGAPVERNYPIAPGQAWRIDLSKGNYVFKLIATRKALDLSPLLDAGKREAVQQDMGLLNALLKNAGLGSRTFTQAGPENILISNIILEVK